MIKKYKLTDVCPGCSRKLESAIKNIDGVNDARISIMSEQLLLDFENNAFDDIIKEVEKLCKRIEPDCMLVIE
ncbi:MAG: heavy metal transporter [Clostridiales bacterium GWF2_36_10]|nr:MAG: heavy metal transporter [Clostridiales bacterium GWF2_36_10]HAN20144.1 heavy metal transporter [Clostridiales bacterium]